MATALHRAALSGDAKQAAALLKLRDVEVDAADKQRRTPLHGAVLAGHTQVAGLLLEARCNTDKADVKGMTPLVFAAGRGDAGLVRLLLKHGAAPRQSLQAAVTQGHTEAAELLLNAGAPVGATSERGASALHFAALKGDAPMLQLLLQRGAPPGAVDEAGRTALHAVALAGHEVVARALRDRTVAS